MLVDVASGQLVVAVEIVIELHAQRPPAEFIDIRTR
jgi:hypothetical protein